MSIVRDTQGNILNPVGPGTRRYKEGSNATEIDWFDSHPRPVEAKTEFQVTKLPATRPPNSGDTLEVVEAIEVPEVPEVVPVAEALSAGVTTSSLPQTTVIA